MNIQQGSVYFDEVNKPTFNGKYEAIVKFDVPYSSPPFVMLSITKLDETSFVREFPYPVFSPKGEHQTGFRDTVLRYECEAVEITNTGFRIKVSTWANNIIYAMRVSWISFGEKKEREEGSSDALFEYLRYLQKYSKSRSKDEENFKDE